MLKTVVTVLISLVVAAGSADANPESIMSVHDLYHACKSSDDGVLLTTCIAYIRGVRDMMQLTGTATRDPNVSAEENRNILPFAACDAPDTEQLRQAFLGWAEKNPEAGARPSVIGVWQTIGQNWPCSLKELPQPPHR